MTTKYSTSTSVACQHSITHTNEFPNICSRVFFYIYVCIQVFSYLVFVYFAFLVFCIWDWMTDTYSASTSVAWLHPITNTNYFPLPGQIFDQINISQRIQIYAAFLCEKSVKFRFSSVLNDYTTSTTQTSTTPDTHHTRQPPHHGVVVVVQS